MTLRTRLTVAYTVIFGVLLAGLGFLSYRVLETQLDADATARLIELTDGLHGYLRFDQGVATVASDSSDPDQAAFVQEATRYYQIFNASDGSVVVQSEALEPLGLRFTPEEVRAFRDQPKLQDIRTDYGTIRMSNSVISSGGQTYLLQVGVSMNSVDAALRVFLETLLWSLPVGLIVVALTGRWMAGLGLAPLAHVAAATRQIDVANLKQRLPVRGTRDELDEVATAFNETLDRLERAVGEMRQFSTSLAHELRTPLAALRGEIELSLTRPVSDEQRSRRLASQLEEIDRLTKLIGQLLMLARAEAGDIALALVETDLSGVTGALVEQLEPVAQAKGVDLRFESTGPVLMRGDEEWLKRLVLNLVDNAIKFTPHGGHVTVRVAGNTTFAQLDVIDNGIGMSKDLLPRIFDPFVRGDSSRSHRTEGAGLGLSLVRWIVDRHHGHIDVTSVPAGGSTFSVRLPLH